MIRSVNTWILTSSVQRTLVAQNRQRRGKLRHERPVASKLPTETHQSPRTLSSPTQQHEPKRWLTLTNRSIGRPVLTIAMQTAQKKGNREPKDLGCFRNLMAFAIQWPAQAQYTRRRRNHPPSPLPGERPVSHGSVSHGSAFYGAAFDYLRTDPQRLDHSLGTRSRSAELGCDHGLLVLRGLLQTLLPLGILCNSLSPTPQFSLSFTSSHKFQFPFRAYFSFIRPPISTQPLVHDPVPSSVPRSTSSWPLGLGNHPIRRTMMG
jgi:hypothetical protein